MGMKHKMYNALEKMSKIVDKLQGQTRLKAYNKKLKEHLRHQKGHLTGSDKKPRFNPVGKKVTYVRK